MMGKLTIQEIAKILVEKNKLSTKEANLFAATMFEIIQQQLDSDGLVKIKGLGTFKMIRVEARESVSVRTGERVMIDSHAKITFTPDVSMKELVNKPFSQFETVVLNEGVEFDDLSEDGIEEDVAIEETVTVEEHVAAQQLDMADPLVAAEDSPVVDTPAEEINTVVQPLMEVVDDTPEEPIYSDDEEDSHSWGKPLCYGLLTLVLMAVSAYGGYWYGQKTATSLMTEIPTEKEQAPEVVVPDSIDAIDVDSIEIAEIAETPVAEEQPAPETKEEQVSEEEPFWKKYEAMDARVRTGAYHIIGTDHEIKVRKGDTMLRIARRELGEEMSCYIEVYNGLKANSELQEGQIIKIPKLKWKLKRK